MSEWGSEWASVCVCVCVREGDWLSKWVSEWVKKCASFVSVWVCECVSVWVSEWVNEWMNEWMNERMYERVIKWLIDWLINWLIEWMSEWVSEGTRRLIDAYIIYARACETVEQRAREWSGEQMRERNCSSVVYKAPALDTRVVKTPPQILWMKVAALQSYACLKVTKFDRRKLKSWWLSYVFSSVINIAL